MNANAILLGSLKAKMGNDIVEGMADRCTCKNENGEGIVEL